MESSETTIMGSGGKLAVAFVATALAELGPEAEAREMRLPTPVASRLAGALAAAAMTAITPLVEPPSMHSALAAPPSAEAQATLKKAFTAAQAGLSSADGLLSSSISTWTETGQPAEETAALFKTRGGLRYGEGRLPEARDDLSNALSLMLASRRRWM